VSRQIVLQFLGVCPLLLLIFPRWNLGSFPLAISNFQPILTLSKKVTVRTVSAEALLATAIDVFFSHNFTFAGGCLAASGPIRGLAKQPLESIG
jgi:hypothetical protein